MVGQESRNSETESRNAPRDVFVSTTQASSLPISDPHPPTSIADSPWFWLLIFSGGALFALIAVGPKYSLRQGGIETKFQNRETAIQWEGQEIESPEAIEATQLPRTIGERDLLIPLRPLFLGIGSLVLLGLVGLSLFQLRKGRESS